MMGWLTPHRAGPVGHQRFREYQCGLCHVLGARHGLLSRLAAGPDLVAFQVLLDVVGGEEAPRSARPCVLSVTGRPLPVRSPTAHTEIAADFGLWMGVEKARDDWQDEGRVLAWLLGRVLDGPGAEARRRLAERGFPVAEIEAALARQARIERQAHAPLAHAAEAPMAVAELAFGFAARNHPSRLVAARRIGRALASWLFWVDGLLDWPRDVAQGRYNPLARSLEGPPPPLPPSELRLVALEGAHRSLDDLDAALGMLRADGASGDGLGYLRSVLVVGPRDRLVRLAALVPSPRRTARDLLPPPPALRARVAAIGDRLWARVRRGRLVFRLQAGLALALAWAFPTRSWAERWWPVEPLPLDTGAIVVDAVDTGDVALGGPSAIEAEPLPTAGSATVGDACANGFGFCDFDACCSENCLDPCLEPCEVGCDACADSDGCCEGTGDSG